MWQDCKALQDYIVGMRRDLHQIPELGIDLPETKAYVTAELDKLGISYVCCKADSGLVATIGGSKPGKVIALRADMDALPIQEETGVSYTSTHPGKMHACGHDTHTAMLLGAAKVLKAHEKEINGTVKLIFQTGEEIAKGSRIIIQEGFMDDVDAVFGTHIGTILDKTIPAGKFIITPGCSMASFDRFIIKAKGVGCHGSTPEKGIDPVNIAAHIVISLQEVLAREISATRPSVMTIGKIAGGNQYNIIPGEVLIEGTIRALEEDVRQLMARRIAEISKAVAATFGGTAEVEMDWGAPPVVNDAAMSALAAKAATTVLGAGEVITEMPAPNMGGEDFAYFFDKAPGAFMFLSSANAAKGTDGPHHNCKFNVDEDVFWKGAAVFTAIVEEYLA